MREATLQRLLRSARRHDGRYTRARIVGALRGAYAAGRRRRRPFDEHAVSEAAKFMEAQRLAIEIVHGKGFEHGSRSGSIAGLMNAKRHTHYDEMARRLRRML